MTQKQERAFQILLNEARIAGIKAVVEITPQIMPMIVSEHANVADDRSPVVYSYPPIADGVCGFGWILIKPANSPFANWCLKQGIGRRSQYERGFVINVSDFRQSLLKKEAYAHAFAAVLSAAGIRAYGCSRID